MKKLITILLFICIYSGVQGQEAMTVDTVLFDSEYSVSQDTAGWVFTNIAVYWSHELFNPYNSHEMIFDIAMELLIDNEILKERNKSQSILIIIILSLVVIVSFILYIKSK